MKKIEEVFRVHRARSHLLSEYSSGGVPFIGNGLSNGGVDGFVKPLPGDRIFNFKGIAISAFCEATVHVPPYIACGRAGNGLSVLEPLKPMTMGQLAYAAAYINRAVRWRFSWYWQTTADRLRRLPIPDKFPSNVPFPVSKVIPRKDRKGSSEIRLTRLKSFTLEELFELVPGDYHSLTDLEPGTTPVVSCGVLDNGVAGLYTVGDGTYQGRLTIALNGSPLATHYHPYTFAAKDDVAVCLPRRPMKLTTQLLIKVMLNRERWRYSYYRKCYVDKLKRFTVKLPVADDWIDEEMIEKLLHSSQYWNFLSGKFKEIGTRP